MENTFKTSNRLDESEVWDYMVQELGIECLCAVASSAFGRDYSDYDECDLYNELWSRDYLTHFIDRFGSHYYNLYKVEAYGICNTLVDDLVEETGREYTFTRF